MSAQLSNILLSFVRVGIYAILGAIIRGGKSKSIKFCPSDLNANIKKVVMIIQEIFSGDLVYILEIE